MNRVSRVLNIADIFYFGAVGFIQPVFALFVATLPGGSASDVGVAATIYLGVRAIFQLPLSRRIDRDATDGLGIRALVAGYAATGLLYFLYPFSSAIWHVFLINAAIAVTDAVAYPGYMKLYTRFAGKRHAGYTWSIHYTLSAMAIAVTASVGGFIADFAGFHVLFVIVGITTLIASGIAADLYRRGYYDKIVRPNDGHPTAHQKMHRMP